MKQELKIDEWDTNREWASWQKIFHFPRSLFSKKATDALEFVWKFSDIDFEALWESGKRWIILDVDECIAPHHGNILPENIEIIKQLIEKWWRIAIFSNMKKSDRYKELEQIGVVVITSRYSKPDYRWFQESKKKLMLVSDQVVMVGDNFLTDGWSIYAGIDFIKVEPIKTLETHRSLNRFIQVFCRDIVDRKAYIVNARK